MALNRPTRSPHPAIRAVASLLLLGVLVGCGRPLTQNESAYLRALQGEDARPASMRLIAGNPAGAVTYRIPVRPRTTCQERIWPPRDRAGTVTVSPGATVLFSTVLLRRDLYRPDMMAGWPEEIDLFSAMLFAHEAVHVWQWQQRVRTGYAPWKALGEHARSPDPYLFDPETDRDFLDYGYEQQGSIVEEYVCCRLLDADAPRTARLRRLIAKAMPVDGLDAALDRPRVRLPWPGARTEGICRWQHGEP